MRLYLSLFVIGPFWARYITVFGAISTSAYFAVLMQLTAVSFRKMRLYRLFRRLIGPTLLKSALYQTLFNF